MAISDAVIGNLMIIYVAVIAGIKAFGLVCGRSFGGGFVLIASSTVVGLILVGTLTWDVSRKATYAISGSDHQDAGSVQVQEICKGGICWHGVAVRSPASQVRFRLPSTNSTRSLVLSVILIESNKKACKVIKEMKMKML
ncbi:receptor protein kinase [Hibiscus syriacus]|uniref:Receptor protein kinase n=1 Tax=Hibiscus syriacus TaxID=106335 RepID=A0A6A3B8C6_HIBSY|nr:receptor protein kinase [Hibiscus syriacus]